jgi:hypothetical protein
MTPDPDKTVDERLADEWAEVHKLLDLIAELLEAKPKEG